ncbi:hypothetical protein ACQP1G_45285 [Nocardia sp. CA-107356]|uniref:hypothetical protein n=1 Tax=Nocardia sp. CA-107356 TaxID=3239972 RepID=UPI003D9111DB
MSIGSVIAIVAVIAVVVKRFYGEPMNARDTFGPPVILLAIGIYSVTKVADLNGTDITWLIIGGGVGLAFGAVRGTTIEIFTRDGHLWQRYTRWTVAVWAVSMVAGFGISTLGTAIGMHHDARPTTLSIGIGMVGEMLTLGLRALSTGIPFAPDRDASADHRDGSIFDRFLPQTHPTQPQSRSPRLPFPTDPAYPRPDPRRYETQPHRPATDPTSHRRDSAPPPGIDRSPTLRDALDWLNRTRNR